MPTGVKKFFVSVLLLSLALSASAATLDDELKYYMNSGETRITAEVTVAGQVYSVVKVNNIESFIFDSSFKPVRDEQLMDQVAGAYINTQYEQQTPVDINAIRSAYGTVNASVADACMRAVDRFLLYSGPGSAFHLIYLMQSIKPKQWAAVGQLNQSSRYVRVAMTDTNDAISDLEAAVSAKDVGRVYDSLDRVNKATSALQTNFSTLASAYLMIAVGDGNEQGYIYAFPVDDKGHLGNCTITSNLSSAFASLLQLTSGNNPFDKAHIISTIKQVTESRYEPAQVRKVLGDKTDKLIALKTARDKLASDYAALGLSLSFLGSRYSQVEAKLVAIANATTVARAEELAASFETERTAFEGQVSAYRALLVDYNATKTAVSNVTTQVLQAATKYGSADSRVQSLQSQKANLSARLTLLEGDMKAGKTVEAQRLKSLADEARSLAANAGGMKPLEAQLDLVLIGGIVLVVAVVVGVILYARRKRPSGMGGMSGGPAGP